VIDTLSLLHLDASASHATTSVSRRLTSTFVDEWRRTHGGTYSYRDLAADPVPLVTSDYVTLGTRVERHGAVSPHAIAAMAEGAGERDEWARTVPLVEQLLAADIVLLGVPMYNYSVPAAMKAWIDRVTFPGVYTDPRTGDSLLAGTRVVVVTARGGGYGPDTGRAGCDFQEPYLRWYFRNLGVHDEDITFVHAEFTRAADIPTLAAFRHLTESSFAAAHAKVVEIATGVPVTAA
jgi:FMN-dependent NADH-azoreductase